ncbi:hypothetical protein [Marinomonas pollencensis]|uniref:hypothetical protein n=1 Tax=Marinomonas pollencensis TaxID=491954 RepID=UPI000E241D06|nr:hypothetical protein [Marinomonas pollencensis]
MKQRNIIVILFALFAFLSQASAAVEVANPIQHLVMQDVCSSSMASSELSSHHVSHVSMDCCKNPQTCSMASCLAPIALVEHQVLLPERFPAHHNTALVIHELPQHNISLYRPPIVV